MFLVGGCIFCYCGRVPHPDVSFQDIDFQALCRGEDRAWEDALKFLWPKVYRVVQSKIGSRREDVEDLTQTVLSKVVQRVRANKVTDFAHLVHLSLAVAHTVVVDFIRKNRALYTEFDEDSHQAAENVLGEVATNDLLGRLEKAMSILSPPEPEMVRDHLLYDLKYRELAEKYRMPIGTVGSKLLRALDKIRRRLERD